MNKLLQLPGWAFVLYHVEKGKYLSQIAKDIDMTYSHVCKIIDVFCSEGIAYREKKGRIVYAKLTKKGRELYFPVKDILFSLKLITEERE